MKCLYVFDWLVILKLGVVILNEGQIYKKYIKENSMEKNESLVAWGGGGVIRVVYLYIIFLIINFARKA